MTRRDQASGRIEDARFALIAFESVALVKGAADMFGQTENEVLEEWAPLRARVLSWLERERRAALPCDVMANPPGDRMPSVKVVDGDHVWSGHPEAIAEMRASMERTRLRNARW